MKRANIQKTIKDYALEELGFDVCRFTSPNVQPRIFKTYSDWILSGGHADLGYLERHLRFKRNPALLLPGVKSAIVLAKNYRNTPIRRQGRALKIARYAVGEDYHRVLGKKLKELEAFISKISPGIQTYSGVDSRPIMERQLAVQAGVGFSGKNTLVIKPGMGSYFFLSVVFTTISFSPDTPSLKDCGECTLCLEACPTGALSETFGMDAKKCLSYQTIERKTPLTKAEIKQSKGWVYGCDICQEVCPYNSGKIPETDWAELRPAAGVGFEFFTEGNPQSKIPRNTPLYRSRKRVVPNWQKMKTMLTPEKQ